MLERGCGVSACVGVGHVFAIRFSEGERKRNKIELTEQTRSPIVTILCAGRRRGSRCLVLRRARGDGVGGRRAGAGARSSLAPVAVGRSSGDIDGGRHGDAFKQDRAGKSNTGFEKGSCRSGCWSGCR